MSSKVWDTWARAVRCRNSLGRTVEAAVSCENCIGALPFQL